jgi:hypothetical protein
MQKSFRFEAKKAFIRLFRFEAKHWKSKTKQKRKKQKSKMKRNRKIAKLNHKLKNLTDLKLMEPLDMGTLNIPLNAMLLPLT